MTKQECAIVEAYTGVCMLTGDDRYIFYKYIAEIMGRPVFTHEIPLLAEEIKEKAKPDFVRLCKEAVNNDQS